MGWIITKDLIEFGEDDGTMGPRTISDETVKRLQAGEGKKFRMYDDDDELYYEGRVLGDDEFSPLDHFGMPNAGCTRIDIHNGKEYQTL